MSKCEHLRFQSDSKIFRLTDESEPAKVIGYKVELEVHCMDCFMPFQFVGLPGGVSPNYPTVSADELTARIPIKPI